jgi:hypothetical protein
MLLLLGQVERAGNDISTQKDSASKKCKVVPVLN